MRKENFFYKITKQEFQELLGKSENRNGKAMVKLASAYLYGDFWNNKDENEGKERAEKAKYWAKMAKKLLENDIRNNVKDSEAMLAFSRLHEVELVGLWNKRYYEKTSFYWCEKAAKLGNAEAMFVFAEYYNEFPLSRNPTIQKERIYWLKKSAQKGNVDAIFEMGEYYYYGNKKTSISWYEKAAEAGDIEAIVKLGKIYWDFLCDEKKNKKENFEKAIYWYEKALEAGKQECMRLLGSVYEAVGDKENMFYWYEEAMKYEDSSQNWKGWCKYSDESTTKKLALLYWEGNGFLEQDYEKAFFYFKKIADRQIAARAQGEKFDYFRHEKPSYYYLYEMYRDGKGVEKNEEEALKYLKEAALAGYDKAVEIVCGML